MSSGQLSQRPARITLRTFRRGSVSTRSATTPGASLPREDASPSTRAGVPLAARTASASGTPLATTVATTSRRVRVPPAIDPSPAPCGSASRATPARTVTRSGPSTYEPSGIPAARGREDEPGEPLVNVHPVGDQLHPRRVGAVSYTHLRAHET